MQQVIQVHTHSRSFVKFNKEEFKDSHFCEGFTTSLIAIPPPCEGNVYRNRPTQQRDISPTKGHCSSYSSDKVLVQVSWQPTTSLMPFTSRHAACFFQAIILCQRPFPSSLSSFTRLFRFTHIQLNSIKICLSQPQPHLHLHLLILTSFFLSFLSFFTATATATATSLLSLYLFICLSVHS